MDLLIIKLQVSGSPNVKLVNYKPAMLTREIRVFTLEWKEILGEGLIGLV